MEEPAPRMFWPREVWGRYAPSLDAFKDPANRPAALKCLNHLVGGAPQLPLFGSMYKPRSEHHPFVARKRSTAPWHASTPQH
jgi:hypothetical protein